MDFLFAPDEDVDRKQLQQGDLLIRTERLRTVLEEAHQYYATADSYTHFVIVTQSCDLVRRGRKPPKTPYITVAAVRPFSIVLERFLEKHAFVPGLGAKYGVYNSGRRELAQQFLERMLNNEEKGYFFFRAGSHPTVKEDLCAFLPLSVALKASHYDALLDAKVAQLDDIFAAKLGWQVGNLYSRVATPDIEEKGESGQELRELFFQEKLDSQTLWLSSTRWKEANKSIKKIAPAEISPARVRAIVDTVPTDMEILAQRAVDILRNSGILAGDDPDAPQRAVNLLKNDPTLRSIARALTD